VDPELFVAADPGVNVLAALVSNKPGFVPRQVNGCPVKAFNQFYNQERAQLQQRLAKATASPLADLSG
jgi:putative transposase